MRKTADSGRYVRLAPLKLTAAMVFAAILSGCGVRGSLDPPPAAKSEGTAVSPAAADAGENSAAKPKPHRDFLLDGLLR